jgi:hypothetical protein
MAEVIIFRHLYDGFDDIWEAATAAPTLFQRMINFCRNKKLPRVSIEKLNDSILDLLLGNNIAMAN